MFYFPASDREFIPFCQQETRAGPCFTAEPKRRYSPQRILRTIFKDKELHDDLWESYASYESDNGARALETFAAAEFWGRHAKAG